MVQRFPSSVLRAHNSENSGIFKPFIQKQRRLLFSTTKGYRSMLSSVYKFCLRKISSSTILPIHRSSSWDLDKILEYLSGPPFEPLVDASFRNKTRKALFLLAMATAKRVGEIQAPSFSVSHQGDDLVLH